MTGPHYRTKLGITLLWYASNLTPPPPTQKKLAQLCTFSHPLSLPFLRTFYFLRRFSNTQSSSFHQKGASPSSTTTAQTHTDTFVGMQTLKSSPTTTAIIESHYTPASRPIPSPRTFTQNINTTIRGKNIGKSTSIRRAAFALVSVFFLWGAPPSPLPPSLISNHKPSPQK